MNTDLELLKGTLDLLVLKAVVFGPVHGYGVARWVRETTDSTLLVDDGALYTSLHRMEKRGWLVSEWGVTDENRRAKFYVLTGAGRRQLKTQVAVWTRYAEAVFKCLGATEAVA